MHLLGHRGRKNCLQFWTFLLLDNGTHQIIHMWHQISSKSSTKDTLLKSSRHDKRSSFPYQFPSPKLWNSKICSPPILYSNQHPSPMTHKPSTQSIPTRPSQRCVVMINQWLIHASLSKAREPAIRTKWSCFMAIFGALGSKSVHVATLKHDHPKMPWIWDVLNFGIQSLGKVPCLQHTG